MTSWTSLCKKWPVEQRWVLLWGYILVRKVSFLRASEQDLNKVGNSESTDIWVLWRALLEKKEAQKALCPTKETQLLREAGWALSWGRPLNCYILRGRSQGKSGRTLLFGLILMPLWQWCLCTTLMPGTLWMPAVRTCILGQRAFPELGKLVCLQQACWAWCAQEQPQSVNDAVEFLDE